MSCNICTCSVNIYPTRAIQVYGHYIEWAACQLQSQQMVHNLLCRIIIFIWNLFAASIYKGLKTACAAKDAFLDVAYV